MAYTINLTNGTTFATIADGTVNTDSSMTLVGKNYAGYGEFLDENFIHLLESGSNSVAPSAPLVGQIWYDSGSASQPYSLKVRTSTKWQRLAAITSSTAQPTSNQTGDLWWDSSNQQLYGYTGAAFRLIGPIAPGALANTGSFPLKITDTLAAEHTVIELTLDGNVVGIVSQDTAFTPSPAIPGFTQVKPGITLANTIGGVTQLFQGTSLNSQQLDGLPASSYLSSVANDTTSGTLGILNDDGLAIGVGSDLNITIDAATSNANIYNQTANCNINLQVNKSSVRTTAIAINGSTGAIGVLGITNLNSNGVGNIGSSSTYFNTVFAKSTSAQYADVAERFAADALLEPGTVVELGGAAEITKSIEELSENVFGVISTNAAYLMNAGAGNNDTHPPVAMTGRVPVRCVGLVKKGDRLVSAGNGLARSAQPGEATPFNTIGRALTGKNTEGEGLVESIVSTK